MAESRKTVFISYSWDNPEHQDWVLNLAKDLTEKYGIIVLLDQYQLHTGSDLPYFMEQSIEKADKVLIILTPNYKARAEERKKGVGYESTMITQEIFESDITKIKFLPILRIGTSETSSPKFLKSKIYHNMVDDRKYFDELLKLAKLIYDHPVHVKPELGSIPDFNEPSIDPIIDKAKALINEKKINQELNAIIDSFNGAVILKNEMETFHKQLNEKANLYKKSTGLNFAYETNDLSNAVIRCEKFSVFFELSVEYSNSAKQAFLDEKRLEGIVKLHNYNFVATNTKPAVLKNNEYKFDLDYSKNVVWKCDTLKFTTTEIIQNAFVFLIGEIEADISKDFRD
ncbi:toll/interleukin-1 receptor domain-containing protein [Flavobacterium artemisiae]|uniref:Toll/interleukin-1 receptor domain-containing protein n=1 Tax=Flavobacterium artemisiae TaxID=2126556 RepID=A0ABW4HDD8_9FLAO